MTTIATPMPAAKSLGGIPTRRPTPTLDPSTSQLVPDFAFGEPVMSSGGLGDELSAAYADARRNSYAAAHAEADAADVLAELDELRNDLAARDFTPAEFAAVMTDQCPGVLFSMTATQYAASVAEGGVKLESRYEGWVKFPGVPTRHLSADSWRALADSLACEFRARRGMGRALPVVSTEAAAV